MLSRSQNRGRPGLLCLPPLPFNHAPPQTMQYSPPGGLQVPPLTMKIAHFPFVSCLRVPLTIRFCVIHGDYRQSKLLNPIILAARVNCHAHSPSGDTMLSTSCEVGNVVMLEIMLSGKANSYLPLVHIHMDLAVLRLS